MKKRLLALMTVLSALALGTTTFTSCNKEDDDKVDTIYVVNKDTVYIENTSSKTDTLIIFNRDTLYVYNNDTITLNNNTSSSGLGVIAEGWFEFSELDTLGNVLVTKKYPQRFEDWGSAKISFSYDWPDNYYIGLKGKHTEDSDLAFYNFKLKPGIYNTQHSDESSLDFDGLDYEVENHSITNVEKIGQFIDGNYLNAIEGYVEAKYRIIAISDKYAEE